MAIEQAGAEETARVEEPSPSAETTMLPITMLAGQSVAPGDVVRLEVVSVNDEDGSVEVKYASAKPNGSAIDEAASVYKSPKQMEV